MKTDTKHVFTRNLRHDYPKIVRGEGVYLYDDAGNQYLDACSGSAVANIGHGNEEIAEVMAEQARKIAFTHLTRFITDPTIELAERIAEMAPGDLGYTYFVSGGSEATEAAIKLCRQYFVERDGVSNKHKIISRWRSYHGNTIGALSMTGKTDLRKMYEPLLLDFPHIAPAYCYRCEFGVTPDECDCQCARMLEKTILREGPENVAGFIFEPVSGSSAAGAYPRKEYYRIIREICDKYDVLMISDEVMNGFGRTGENFGIDNFGVVPDVMCIAKGVSSGYIPLGGIVISEKVMSVFRKGPTGRFVHGHTYTGSPISCAVGCKTLEIIKRENLVQNSKKMGKLLKSKLEEELADCPIVGDIRGMGLQMGIEFVKDKDSKTPFSKKIKLGGMIARKGLDNGIVLYPGSSCADTVNGDLILLTPPLIVNADQVEEIVQKIKITLSDVIEEVL